MASADMEPPARLKVEQCTFYPLSPISVLTLCEKDKDEKNPVTDSAPNKSNVLVLSSTQRLLTRLGWKEDGEPSVVNEKDLANDVSVVGGEENRVSQDKEMEEEQEEHAEEEDVEMTEKDSEKEPSQEEQKHAEEESQKEETSTAQRQGGRGIQKKTEKQSTPPELQHLQRVDNLNDLIRSALNDIRFWKNRNLNKGKQNRGDHSRKHEQRWQALEHQRLRLQQQKERQASASSTDSKEDPAQDMDNMEEEEEEEEGAVVLDNPWILMVRTLNSLSLLTPILLDILFHEHRNNRDMKLGKSTLTKKENGNRSRGPQKAVCWLLSAHVYDMCSVQACKGLHRFLQDIYEGMGILAFSPPKGNDPNELLQQWNASNWRAFLDKLMVETCQAAAENLDGSATIMKHEPQHPLQSFVDSSHSLEELDQLVQTLDNTLELTEAAQTKEELNHRAAFDRCVNNLHKRLSTLLQQRFQGKDTRLSVYGSCLSKLSLGPNSDVDLSLHLGEMERLQNDFEAGRVAARRYDSQRKSMVYAVCRRLEKLGDFCHLQPVAHARVPVIKGTWTGGRNPYATRGVQFDICLCNDIAVVNSSLIREYCNVDARVRQLGKAVKHWAKTQNISSAAESTLSSYTWMNMVLVYLQAISFVPNLQSHELAVHAGVERSTTDPWQSIRNLDTFYLKWVQVQDHWKRPALLENLSVTALLYGFWDYFANQASPLFVLGVKGHGHSKRIPRTAFRRGSWLWCVEDPFETHDSHCPHDLGSHADEQGVKVIRNSIHYTWSHFKEALEQFIGGQSFVSDILTNGNKNQHKNNNSNSNMKGKPKAKLKAAPAYSGPKNGGGNSARRRPGPRGQKNTHNPKGPNKESHQSSSQSQKSPLNEGSKKSQHLTKDNVVKDQNSKPETRESSSPGRNRTRRGPRTRQNHKGSGPRNSTKSAPHSQSKAVGDNSK